MPASSAARPAVPTTLPDGITIELNFFGIKSEPAWLVGAENYADMPRVVACSN